MTTTDELFPSNYLKAADIAHEPVLTIKEVQREKMKNRDGEEESKPVLYFVEMEKGIVLNRTNSDTIASLYGNVIEEWVGRRVQLFAPMIESFGKVAPAIRVKGQKPPADMKTLLEHYQKLFARAKKAKVEGVNDYVVPANISESELIELGKDLKTKVEAAEAFG